VKSETEHWTHLGKELCRTDLGFQHFRWKRSRQTNNILRIRDMYFDLSSRPKMRWTMPSRVSIGWCLILSLTWPMSSTPEHAYGNPFIRLRMVTVPSLETKRYGGTFWILPDNRAHDNIEVSKSKETPGASAIGYFKRVIVEEGDLCVQKERKKRGQSGWNPETSVATRMSSGLEKQCMKTLNDPSCG
jgi:hypothetical protein